MFSRIGLTELIIILVIALLIFGPSALPKIGKSIGKTMGEFKKGLREESDLNGAEATVKKTNISSDSDTEA